MLQLTICFWLHADSHQRSAAFSQAPACTLAILALDPQCLPLSASALLPLPSFLYFFFQLAMSPNSLCLAIALLLAIAPQGYAQTALSDWIPGVATNYGGTASGMNPNVPSFGLSNVSCHPHIAVNVRHIMHSVLL